MRELVGTTLDRLPAPWFRRLRAAYARAVADGDRGIRRRTLQAAVAVARYRSLPEDEFTVADYPDVRLTGADSVVTSYVYWFGGDGYEGAETRWWRRACRRATSILELGANVGYYTVQGARANPRARYVAVEPHPTSAAIVRRNLELNGLEHVEVIEAAATAGGAGGTVSLAIPDQDRYGAPAGAFVPEGGEGVDGIAAARTIEVPTVDVQDLIADVDLLKLDIEGHEAEVLEPVLDDLRARRPTIFLEVRLAATSRLRDLLAKLTEGTYAVFAIGRESLHLVPRDELTGARALPRYGSRDLMLVDAAAVAEL